MKIDLNFFFMIFSFISFIAAVLVICSKNPLHSIIFLIIVFCNIALLLLVQEIEFLALVFLIVYIGAIAVLFLFVIYMLNIKVIELTELNWQYLIGFFVSLFFIGIFLLTTYSLNYSTIVTSITNDSVYDYLNWNSIILNLNNIHVLATMLYLDFFLIFILLSVILLLAMLGAIVLTTKRTWHLKEQIIFEQNYRQFKNND